MRTLGKQQKVQDKIAQYNQHVASCLDVFEEALADICSDASREELKQRYVKIQAAEKAADETRRCVENMMYSEAVFPESRGDILGLIEAMDSVANHSESSVRMVLSQHITVPPVYWENLTRLVKTCHRCVCSLLRAAEQLFESLMDAAVTVGEIHRLESEADVIEEDLIDAIFSGDEPDLQKILLRDLVKHVSQIADSAETAGDRIRIMVAKRSI